MSASTVLPLWKGRTLALLGVLLVAANLRTAVAALSPIFFEIRHDFPISSIGVGVLGMLPPVCFAVFGICAPFFTRRWSLEAVIAVAMGVLVLGTVVRSLSGSIVVLAIGSAIAFAGMGTANVLLPPLVKRYFPDRIGLLTTLYATVLALGTLVPPLIAVPVSNAAGWRAFIAVWAVWAAVAIVPWAALVVRNRPTPGADDGEIEEPEPAVLGRVWHSPIAWGLAVVFAVSSINAYAMFAWLPEILRDTAGVNAAQAGALLSLYASIGLPTALFVPLLASRMRNVGILIYAGVLFFVLGYLGLIFAPSTATWLWVILAGLGPGLFPLCLLLINLRTRTHEGAVALSGFTQGLGYTLGALGPLLVGVLHQVTGDWTLALVVLIVSAGAAAAAGFVVARPHMLEDSFRS